MRGSQPARDVRNRSAISIASEASAAIRPTATLSSAIPFDVPAAWGHSVGMCPPAAAPSCVLVLRALQRPCHASRRFSGIGSSSTMQRPNVLSAIRRNASVTSCRTVASRSARVNAYPSASPATLSSAASPAESDVRSRASVLTAGGLPRQPASSRSCASYFCTFMGLPHTSLIPEQ
jgi:hypothetical protein